MSTEGRFVIQQRFSDRRDFALLGSTPALMQPRFGGEREFAQPFDRIDIPLADDANAHQAARSSCTAAALPASSPAVLGGLNQ